MGDPEEYRDEDEVAEWRQRDPIARFARRCLPRAASCDEEDADGDRTRRSSSEVDAGGRLRAREPDPGERRRCAKTSTPDSRESELSLRPQALNEALREEMARDETVCVLGEDIAVWARRRSSASPRGLLDRFGAERVRDTPISEEGIVGPAVGAAVTGTRPVAELMYLDFVGLAMDQIVNQAAKLRYMFGGKARVPMVAARAGGAGRGNAAQHSQSLEAWFVHIPGLKVVVPATPGDAKGLLKSAIRDDNPVIFLEHKVLYATKGDVPEDDYVVPFGQAAMRARGRRRDLRRDPYDGPARPGGRRDSGAGGRDRVEVIDPRTLVPLDVDTIVESVETHRSSGDRPRGRTSAAGSPARSRCRSANAPSTTSTPRSSGSPAERADPLQPRARTGRHSPG